VPTDNASAWDQYAAAYQAAARLPTDVVHFGPDLPTEAALHLLGEVKGRRVNPGRAVMLAVALLAVVDILAQVGLQGLVPSAQLQANAADAPVYAVGVLAGPGWAKAMAAAIALSVVATTGVGIVLTARIIYGMAAYRVLPPVLANVSPRFSTPVAASVLTGVVLLGLAWVYTLGTSLQSAFNDVVSVSGWLFGSFYVLTGLVISSPRQAVFNV